MNLSILPALALSSILLSCGSPTPTSESADTAPDVGRTYDVQLSSGMAQSVVYETSKPGEMVLLEVYNDRIAFTALISRSKFEEVMTLKPPTYFEHQGVEYVKNDGIFFWGNDGNEESVSIDGVMFGGFVLNGSQIAADGQAVQTVLAAAQKGDRLQIEKHYWGPNGEKGYPTFPLSGLHENFDQLTSASATSFVVSDSQTRCRQEGLRKIVWLETDEGTFALNGPAITLVETSAAADSPWRDTDGRLVRLGRDVLGLDVTSSMIEAGLRSCD